jgi:xyloglucan-specific exo-beta-1,4-glucanase
VTTVATLGFGKAAPGASYPAIYLTGVVGGVQGIFRSANEGVSWVRINDGQHQYAWIGQTITGDPHVFGRVYLGTNGRGILAGNPAGAPS